MSGSPHSGPKVSKAHPNVRNNNFDLIRLLLAAAVFLSHSYSLSQNASLEPLAAFTNARVAVESFFVISGFLIFMSYDSSRSLRDYFRKRARRIYPAYLLVILLSVAAGTILTSLPLGQFLAEGAWQYVAASLTFMTFLFPSLPGVFSANPYSDVNGALWTIKVEVMFYLSVPAVAVLMRRFGKIQVLSAIYVLSLAYKNYFERTGVPELARQLPAQMCFFVGGALIYLYFARFERRALALLIPSIAIIAIEPQFGIALLYPLALAVTVLYAACFLPRFTRFRPRWDLSYGIYIFHFPILQTLISLGCFRRHPMLGEAAAIILVFGFASLSWNLVEERFLRMRAI